MRLVEEDICLNPDYVPDLPPEWGDPSARLDSFRAKSGQLAVRYMVIAIADAFESPRRRPEIEAEFVAYFGDALTAEGHNPKAVFEAAFDACLGEQLVFGADEAGYFGGFRPSRRP